MVLSGGLWLTAAELVTVVGGGEALEACNLISGTFSADAHGLSCPRSYSPAS